jgi:hypothetical protein
MKKLMLVALATTALTGSALAFESDAFISQVGNGHDAANIQLGQNAGFTTGVDSGQPSVAVILQEQAPGGTNGHTALQVQLDPGNFAYTFQSSTFGDDDALTWQDGTGNSAVTVQVSTATGSQEEEFSSDIIQNGNNNVAVNWQSDVPSSATMTVTPSVPGLTVFSSSINVTGGSIGVQGDFVGLPWIDGTL